MIWKRLKLWFDRTISSSGIRQLLIPTASFLFSFLLFCIPIIVVNKEWRLVGRDILLFRKSHYHLWRERCAVFPIKSGYDLMKQ